MAYSTFQGTHGDDFAGIPATGEQVAVQDITLHHIDDGQIVEEWVVRDSLGLLVQLGGAPTDDA